MAVDRFIYTTMFVVILVSTIHQSNGMVYQLIRELIQNNVAGEPLVHKTTVWDFDPEAAEKRRELFYEQHGFRAAKFIERIGVGIDGQQQERRAVQAERDQGRLNGEHFRNFP